jgi:hypothetical protein
MSYTAGVTAKGRFLVATLCLMAVLAAAIGADAGDSTPAVLVVVATWPLAQVALDPPHAVVAGPVETPLAGLGPARAPPLA